jgi:phosphoribosylaminoimidazole-succinocarboxamide synthase
MRYNRVMKSGQGIASTGFLFPGQTAFYKGSVRDVYSIRNKYLVMVVTDRISAFDVVLPVTIPYKGQVLSQIAVHFLDATKDIVPNWFIVAPDPNVVIGLQCRTFKIEMVIRSYLVGHAWREYRDGKRELCGVTMPDGLKENDKFPEPIITPATHAAEGHDEDISAADIVSRGLIPAEDYKQIEQYTRQLFERGTALAAERGLILVDTKYEFGKKDGQIYLIDEIHTPDSSRYFYADGYEERLAKGEPQRQLSKEFVREWLIAHDFQGLEGQAMPDIPDDFVEEISKRYIELYEQLTGQTFTPPGQTQDAVARIEANVINALEKL